MTLVVHPPYKQQYIT